jgi:hypothetical protein
MVVAIFVRNYDPGSVIVVFVSIIGIRPNVPERRLVEIPSQYD